MQTATVYVDFISISSLSSVYKLCGRTIWHAQFSYSTLRLERKTMASKPWLVVLILLFLAVLVSSKFTAWEVAEENKETATDGVFIFPDKTKIDYAEKKTTSQDGPEHVGKAFTQFPGKVDISGDHVNPDSLAQGLWGRQGCPHYRRKCAPKHCRCSCWCDGHGVEDVEYETDRRFEREHKEP